jgi:hypothetical protein
MRVELCVEGMGAIVRAELGETLKNLKDDLKRRKNDTNIAIFHLKKDEDIAELERHVEAFKMVMRYYGAP